MHLGAKFCFASIAFSEYLVEKFQGEFTNTQSNRSTDPHRNQTLLLFLSLKARRCCVIWINTHNQPTGIPMYITPLGRI